jgi:hypothetical protein
MVRNVCAQATQLVRKRLGLKQRPADLRSHTRVQARPAAIALGLEVKDTGTEIGSAAVATSVDDVQCLAEHDRLHFS